jgi:hypothetical protein
MPDIRLTIRWVDPGPGAPPPVTHDIDPRKTILDLKREIHTWHGVPPGEQLLFFDGSLLEDANTLHSSGIRIPSPIDLREYMILSKFYLVDRDSNCPDRGPPEP